MTRTLSYAQARDFYDRFGAKQDAQGWYENAPLRTLRSHARFHESESVLEFGCGTGKFANALFRSELPDAARYVGLDVSPTMVALALERLSSFARRADVRLTDDARCFKGISRRPVARTTTTWRMT